MGGCPAKRQPIVSFTTDPPEVHTREVEPGCNFRPTPKNFREMKPREITHFYTEPGICLRAENEARRLKRWADAQLKPWTHQAPMRHNHDCVGSSGILRNACRVQPAGTNRLGRHKKGCKQLWMLDSGSRFHLIDPKDIADPDGTLKDAVIPISPIRLKTANGRTATDSEVPLFIDTLAETLDVMMLDKCPPLISLGTLIERLGYDFHWKSGHRPYLQHSRRRHLIFLEVIDHIPYLPDAALAQIMRSPLSIGETIDLSLIHISSPRDS